MAGPFSPGVQLLNCVFHPRLLPGMENLASPFGLEGGDVRCLQALWTLSDIEFDRLPLGE